MPAARSWLLQSPLLWQDHVIRRSTKWSRQWTGTRTGRSTTQSLGWVSKNQSWAFVNCLTFRQATTRQCDNVLQAKIRTMFASRSQNEVSTQYFSGYGTGNKDLTLKRCQIVTTVVALVPSSGKDYQTQGPLNQLLFSQSSGSVTWKSFCLYYYSVSVRTVQLCLSASQN